MPSDIAYDNLNTLAVATLPKYVRGKVEDVVFDANLFLDMIRKNGKITDYKDGTGKQLVQHIRIGRNSTVANRSMKDKVPQAEQETMTNAAWDWGSMTGSITFFDVDLHDNMGKQQLIDILQTEVDVMIDTWAERMSKNILQETSADSAFQFLGLKDAVSDGTRISPATYGSLSRATYPGWAAVVQNNAGVLENLIDDLNTAYDTASYGGIQPDFVLTTQLGVNLARRAMGPGMRYTDFQTGELTINGVTFRGKPMAFDRFLTSITSTPSGSGSIAWSGTTDTASTNRFYLLNTKYWEFHFDANWNMENAIESGWRIPTDEYSRSKLMAIRGQLICKQPRYQALVVNVPAI